MAATRSTSKTEAAGRGGAWVGGMVVFGLAFALTAVACYDPMIADGHLTCTADTDCPSGFFCATTCEPGLCYHKTVAGQQLALTCTVVDTHRSADGGTGGGSGAGAGGVPAGGAGGGGGQTGAGGGGIVGGGGAGASGPGGGGGTIAGVGGHGGAIVGGSGGTTTGGAGMTGGAGATGMGGHVGAGGATAGMGGHTGAGGTIVGGSGGTPGLGGATGAGGKTGMGGAMGLGGAMGQGGAPGLGLGATCSTGTQCASGFCVDKVCCNVACADQCSACDITPGTCSPVASGPAHGTRLACGGTGVCGAQCRLITPASAACVFAAGSVSCGAQICGGSTLTAAAMCNGAGTCGPAAAGPCPLGLICNAAGTACLASCTTNADCTAAVPFCNPSTHQCTTARPIGSSCLVAADCQNSLCIDSFCCDAACNGSCQACNNMGQEGHCSLVLSGQPHGLRTPCGAAGSTCGGRCDGTDAQCHFPMGNSCTCPDGLGLIGSCDGKGECMTALNVCLL